LRANLRLEFDGLQLLYRTRGKDDKIKRHGAAHVWQIWLRKRAQRK
jgi:hypothetical protein